MKISQVSPLTGKTTTMDINITEGEIAEWRRGGLIQEVVPHLTPHEREFLMTGCTPGDWVAMFGIDEDEEV